MKALIFKGSMCVQIGKTVSIQLRRDPFIFSFVSFNNSQGELILWIVYLCKGPSVRLQLHTLQSEAFLMAKPSSSD